MSALSQAAKTAVIAARGFSTESLAAEVDSAFGTIEAAVATGSLMAGYGNRLSDLDVYAVVDAETFPLPIVNHEAAGRVDTRFFSARAVAAWPKTLSAAWPPPGLTRDRWLDRRFELEFAVRFDLGLPLVVAPAWSAWFDDLRQLGLATVVSRWWRIEALRRREAACWAPDGSARQAHLLAESARAVLEADVAATGHIFLGAKWLGEKLKAIGRSEALKDLRSLERWRGRAEVARRAKDYALSLEATSEPTLTIEAYWAPGVRQADLGGRLALTRWDLRTTRLPDGLGDGQDGAPVWRGPLGETPPEDIRDLFNQNFLWIAVASEATDD